MTTLSTFDSLGSNTGKMTAIAPNSPNSRRSRFNSPQQFNDLYLILADQFPDRG
jgi:hypothetical protein